MKQEDWTKRLRDQLADYEEAAPADLWAGIEAKLAQQAAPKRRSRVVPMWGRWAAAAAVFVGLLIGNGYLMYTIGQDESAQGTVAQTAAKPVLQETPASQETPVSLETPEAPFVSARTLAAPSALIAQAAPQAPAETPVNPESQETPVVPATPSTPAPSVDKPAPKQPLPSQQEVLRQLDEKIAMAQRQRRSRVGFALYAQNGFVNHLNINGVQMSLPMNHATGNTVGAYADGATASYSGTAQPETELARTRAAQETLLTNFEERQKYYQPISIGLTANIPISPKLSLTTGLVYTRLRSEFVTVMAGNPMEREQTLQYIGIPVTAQYQLWSYHRLNIYAAAGGQADFNFKAEDRLEGVEQELGKDHVQWSVNGAVGVQYDVFPQVGVYAEPGVKYYFDNGSNLRNFFKDKPTNFNLQVGVRFNLGQRRKN